jgi:hypothetical protein
VVVVVMRRMGRIGGKKEDISKSRDHPTNPH